MLKNVALFYSENKHTVHYVFKNKYGITCWHQNFISESTQLANLLGADVGRYRYSKSRR